MNVLIVHGPNLNLLGEAKGDPCSYSELNERIAALASQLGASVKVVQSNHEGALIDRIQAERRWAQAILINPGALTHTSYSLRECLRIVDLPAIEVHLEDIRRRETWRRKSVIKDVCEAQVMGKGLDSYLEALERLVSGKYRGPRKALSKETAAVGKAKASSARQPKATKTIGRASASTRPANAGGPIAVADPSRLLRDTAQAIPAKKAAKTIGPGSGEPVGLVKSGINRDAVRERIAALLGHKITPSALATWAREQWLNLERGAATEMGQRELLSEALQSLALSATPAGRMSDDELIELMARLG